MLVKVGRGFDLPKRFGGRGHAFVDGLERQVG